MQAAGVSGVQVPPPHRLATPVPPQVWPAGQAAAQLSEPPQPLPMIPQYWPPVGVQVAPGQVGAPHELGMPAPPQVWPVGAAVAAIDGAAAAVADEAAVLAARQRAGAVGRAADHAADVATPPPPQTWPVGQAPQSIWASQPSPTTPQ